MIKPVNFLIFVFYVIFVIFAISILVIQFPPLD